MLGYVVDRAGVLRLTTRGKIQTEAGISKPLAIGSVAATICRADPDTLGRQSRPRLVHEAPRVSAYAICAKPELSITAAVRPDLAAYVVIRHGPRNAVCKSIGRRDT
jgi:hypothetical protein